MLTLDRGLLVDLALAFFSPSTCPAGAATGPDGTLLDLRVSVVAVFVLAFLRLGALFSSTVCFVVFFDRTELSLL